MRSVVYINSLRFGLSQVINYRSDVWLNIATKLVSLAGVVFLWSVIGKSTGGLAGVGGLVSYFLIASGVQGLVDAESLRFSRAINYEVKNGSLSAHLLRPVNTVMFIYFSFLGTRGVTLLMTLSLMFLGFSFLSSITLLQIGLFVTSLGLAFVVGFVFNLLVGSLSFWTPEAGHLQNVISHVLKVFSGVMIPISFFSGATKTVLLLLPFPALAYLPSMIMQSSVVTGEMVTIFLATTLWCLLLLPLSFWIWKKGLKRYEAIGI